MAIRSQVDAVVKQFQKDNPKAGKADLKEGNRSVEEQLKIIIDRQTKDYKDFVGRFKKKFNVGKIPAYDTLSGEQSKWCNTEIMKQAGKPNGFAHIGRMAQDISVKELSSDDKVKLSKALEDKGFSVFSENGSDYGIHVDKAKLFHVYKK